MTYYSLRAILRKNPSPETTKTKIPHTMKLEIITWNTGRTYTANGQRIAAALMPAGIAMVDIDRGISYLWEGATREQFTRSSIMHAYDNNEMKGYIGNNPDAKTYDDQPRAILERAAAQVAPHVIY